MQLDMPLATNQVRMFTCDNCQRSVVLKPVINSMFTGSETERETSLNFFGRYNSNRDFSFSCRRGEVPSVGETEPVSGHTPNLITYFLA